MVERVALDEDGQVGEGVVALGEMVEVGVGFAAEVGKRDGLRGALTLVINGEVNCGRHAAKPAEVLGVAGYDEFDAWRCGVHYHANSWEAGTRGAQSEHG
jgi:hypothetical protein